MSADATFQTVMARGWRLGFDNLLRKEQRRWWKTRRWLIQSGIWLALLNGFLALLLFVFPGMTRPDGELAISGNPVQIGLEYIFTIAPTGLGIGIIILLQDAILRERHFGTAAWVLSKPASRSAFILAKLVANTIGMVLILIALQGVVAYAQLALVDSSVFTLANFAGSLGMLALHTFFYLTLTLMLGVLADSQGQVLGIGLGTLLGGMLLVKVARPLTYVTPWALSDLSVRLAQGSALPAWAPYPIAATAVWSIVFVAVALLGFNRAEL
jgi:ABC-2 type transport system permease protein